LTTFPTGIALRQAVGRCRRLALLLLTMLAGVCAFGQIGARAAPLVFMPGAPLLSVVPPINGYIFDLTPAVFNPRFGVVQQTGSIVPRFPLVMAPDVPVVGGPCAGFRTGELCRTLEPGAGFGVRDWEVELANETGPAVERFVAGFFAPGLAARYLLTIPLGTGWWFDFRYVGPTVPLFGVFSRLPSPVDIATSIVDPFSINPLPPVSFDDPTVCGNNCTPTFTPATGPTSLHTSAGVPEPASVALLGVGMLALGMARRRKS
jgi:hypothetical protein